MTKKDLFRLIVKMFGLYSVISIIFSAFPSTIAIAVSRIDLIGIAWLAGSLIVVILLFMFLIYNPDNVISWLRLDKGFDDDRIDFQNFSSANILKLGVIVIGGMMLINNIPTFLSYTFFAFNSSVGNDFNGNLIKYTNPRDYIYWATSFLNIVLGYIMLTNSSYLSTMLKEKETDSESSPNK